MLKHSLSHSTNLLYVFLRKSAFRRLLTRSIYSSTLSLAIRFATSIRSLIAWIVMDSVAFLVASRIFKTFVSCFFLRARGLSNFCRVLLTAICFTGENLVKNTKNGLNSRKIFGDILKCTS